MNNILSILWNPDVVAFSIGPVEIRWYSLCWVIGIFAAYQIIHHMYREQKIAEEKFDPMLMYCFVGILVGARLGHCLFYEPEYFIAHPIEMILPMRKYADGQWHFTGYEGLASHGGGIGLITALLFYCRKTKLNVMRVIDNVSIVTPLCGCAIRIGNLMNSEIIGNPAPALPWAFIFPREDMQPRHPSQLYEALCYLIIFFVLWAIYKKSIHSNKLPQTNSSKSPMFDLRVGSGFYFGMCIFLIYICRILIEFTKENQVDFEDSMTFNMGQLLSIPYVLVGLYCIFGGKWCRKLGEY